MRILNGDHAQELIDRAASGADPKKQPDWPYPSFDARDWAEAFIKRVPECPYDLAHTWFANALMRGYDER